MKTLSLGLCVVMLAAAAGCSESVPQGPEAAAPAPHPQPTQPVQVVVKKPVASEAEHAFSLSVPFESITLVQGAEEAVRIGINRGVNFGEEVAVSVTGLPAGVAVEADQPVITQGETGVTLKLKAASDAALGDFTARVTGRTASSGADFSKEIKLTVSPKSPK
jgi:uncharacterized membrane protein